VENVSDPVIDAQDEAALVRRARAHDRAAFDAIVVAHRSVVFAVARRMLGSVEDAEEAAQETFLRAWRSLGSFRGDASLRTWLVRIAVNAARDVGSRRRPFEALDDVAQPEARETTPAAGLREEQERRAVRAAVAKLPPRQREAVVLKVLSEMTYEDVAAAMQLSVGAVKAHVHQAVANLRRLMGAPSP
jgi:RNA polymerase sigma-70 factor (ECF subfamily)